MRRILLRLSILLIAFSCTPSCARLSDEDRIILSEQYPSIKSNQPLIMNQMVNGDKLTLRGEAKFAGAISSIVFRGQEYINSADHGRLLQGAISYNGRYECFNPTQAGGSRDGRNMGGRSTSQRGRSFVSPDGFFEVSTRMAYWLRPGMSCTIPGQGLSPVDNNKRLSPDIYSIRTSFGLNGRSNVASNNISYTIRGTYKSAVIEALTIYMPPIFDTFHSFDPQSNEIKLEPTVTPDETKLPVILSTADGAHAFAFVSLQPGATYARFRFPDTNKISLVYRDTDGITGDNHFAAAWIIGTRDEVATEMRRLVANR